MLKACVYSIDQGIQVLYTLSLLSLLELALHTDKLTLYTIMASHTDKHTVFNSRFFSLYNLYFSRTCVSLSLTLIQTQWTRRSIYTNISRNPSYQMMKSQSDCILTIR